MADRVGQQLGNYQLQRLLGEGGFAEVYLGEHIHLGTQAAIKVLSTKLTEDDLEGFRQEARTIARLLHPNIVRVLEFGVERSTPFLVMDYAAGGTLRQRYPRGSRLALDTILPLIKQVAEALQYAHDEKLVHRDIKPENMLVGRRAEVLLSDFGIATVAQSSRYQGTQEVAGTVAYMAPEQVQGKPRPASDQYSLGIVVYEWLTGTRPFHGSFTEIATQHVLTPPTPLREKLETISPAVEQAVMIALAKDPKERFATVLAFANALEQAALLEQPTQYLRPSGASQAFPAAQAPTVVVPPSRRPTQGDIPLTSTPPPAPLFQAMPLVTYRGHTGWIYALAWSPDGTTLASASDDKTVHLWTAARGDRLCCYTGHTSEVWSVGWSPNGERLVSAGSAEKAVHMWHVSGQHERTYRGHASFVMAVAWSPDGAMIASSGTQVQLWEVQTGALLASYGNALTFALAWSPNGAYLASGGDEKAVEVYDRQAQHQVLRYQGHIGQIRTVAWSPDGRYLASGGKDQTVQIWEAETGEPRASYHGHTDTVRAVTWSPDGTRIASASEDKTVHIWEALTGRSLLVYRNHSQAVLTVAWSPDGTRLASAGRDQTVQVWQLQR